MNVLRPTKTASIRGYTNTHKGYDDSGQTPLTGFSFDDGVYASFDGEIVSSVDKYTTSWINSGTLTTADYGNFFKLKGDSLFQLSAHLLRGTVPLLGTRFKRGDRIATIGNTGNSTGRHCHTEYRFLNGINTPVKFDLNFTSVDIIMPPTDMDDDKRRAIQNLDNYRLVRTRNGQPAPGGNYEGYVNEILGSDRDVENVQRQLDTALRRITELEQTTTPGGLTRAELAATLRQFAQLLEA